MITALHVGLYLGVVLVGWLALVLAIAMVIHGRAWVGDRVREASSRIVRRHRPQREPLTQPVASPYGQAATFTRRGGRL